MNRYITTRTLTAEEHRILTNTGFILRWLAHIDHDQDVFEIYAQGPTDPLKLEVIG